MPYIMQPILGLMSLATSSFSQIFVLVTGVAILIALKSNFLFASVTDKKLRMKYVLTLFGLTQVLVWISLFISYTTYVISYATYPGDVPSQTQSGGFPLRAFEYPGAALGGDVPPSEMWPQFYLNYLFWFIVSIIIFALLRKKLIPAIKNNLLNTVFLVIALLITLSGLGYVMLQFD